MKLLSKVTFLLLLVSELFPAFINAQFKTSTPIYAGALSPDKSKIALVDSERISILKTNNFEEISSIPCNHKTNGVVTEIFFLPNNDSLICYRTSKFNGDLRSDLNLIYFSDSLYFGNFVSRFLKSYAGNVHASYGANSGDFCVFANYGHEFNFNNQQLWWADGTFLYTKELEDIQLKTPVFRCALSGDGEKIAILSRSGKSDKPNELQVLDIHSQNIIYKEVLPEQYYTNLQFSTEGNSIHLEACRLFSSSMYFNYISDLEDVKDTIISIYPGTNVQLESVLGKQENGIRLLPTGNEFKIIDVKTQKEQHVFWANACELFNIRNAFLLNENEVIVYGSFSNYSGSAPSGAANKIKLTDVSAYTQIDERTGSYRLFDPDEVRILPNTSAINTNSEEKIVVGKNKKLVYVIQERYMEMWGIEDQSILRRLSFENDIDVLADRFDSTLLVLEQHEDLNENNIRMHLVNLNTGLVSFQILSKTEVDDFARKNSFSKISDIETSALLNSVQKSWPWDQNSDLPIFETSISTDNKKFVLLDKQLLNLKTLERIQVKNFSNQVLLNNEYIGMAAELCTQNYWSLEDESSKTKNTYFVVKDIRPGGNTLAISPRFKLQFDVSIYNSEISRSTTSRFICAYVNEFFKETQRDIYLFDIQKNKVHEFVNAGLSWIQFSESDSLFQIVKSEMNDQGEMKYSYQLYDAYTFKKIGESNSSLLSKTLVNAATSELNSPENSFDAWYITSESTKKHFGFFPSGKMYVWHFGENSPFESSSLGTGKPIHCSMVGENIFVVLNSREAFFIDPTTNKVVCTILFTPNGENTDILWFLPDGSFYTNKNTIPKFHMVKGKDAFPLLSFEVLLNRPDRILKVLGLADFETIDAFEQAYQKRNRKYKNGVFNFSSEIPEIQLKTNIASSTKDSVVTFSFSILSNTNDSLTAHVLLNGVPLYGMKGNLLPPKTNTFECIATLESGVNEIVVFVQSNSGLTSFALSKEINCTNAFDRRLFFVGIGVSEYTESTKNLTYAHSDVLKLSEEFHEAYEDKFNGLVLTNELATRNNILEIKKFLQKTGVNDIVVVAFAGHGTIGNNREFYFCPNDVNFTSPENSGVSYAEIEELLDSIPARKKLLLLDACHSGEIDSTYAPVFVSDIVTTKDKRGIDVVEIEETSSEKQINYLVESLFSNLNTGTGAFVISASAGSEYAFETEQTGGVFTYSFLESFKTHFYSYTPDPFITTLQKETYQKVIELTKGAQRPTTRAENTRNVWKFEQ